MQCLEVHAGGQKANNTKALFLLYVDALSIVARRSSAMGAAKRSDGCFKCAEAYIIILPLMQYLHMYWPLQVLTHVLTISLSGAGHKSLTQSRWMSQCHLM